LAKAAIKELLDQEKGLQKLLDFLAKIRVLPARNRPARHRSAPRPSTAVRRSPLPVAPARPGRRPPPPVMTPPPPTALPTAPPTTTTTPGEFTASSCKVVGRNVRPELVLIKDKTKEVSIVNITFPFENGKDALLAA
jgi:hypothetical protein